MSRSLDGNGYSPDDGSMDARIGRMEERLTVLASDVAALVRDVAFIRSTYVTKEDLQREIKGLYKEINKQTWALVKFVCGFGTALVAATYFIATQVR